MSDFFGDHMDCSPPGSSVHGISQAIILEWVSIFFSRGLSSPPLELRFPDLAGGFFTTEPPGKRVLVILLYNKFAHKA